MGKITRTLTGAAAVILAATAGAVAFQDEGTVRIGLLESQTGVPAPYGLQGLEGTRIAFDEINAKGGVNIDGKMVKLVMTPSPNGYDPAADSPLTIALIKKLMFDDEVLMIKGTSRSQNTEVAFNYLNELEKQGSPIVLMSSAAAAPGLGKISRWGFRNAFSENDIIERQIRMLKDQFGVKTAGLYVVRDNTYCTIMEKFVIMPLLQKHGIEVKVVTDGLDADRDLSRQVDQLRQANVDAVFVSATTLPSIGLMKDAGRRGFKPKFWVGTVANITSEMAKLGGPTVERMMMGSSFSPGAPQVKPLAEEYRKRTGHDINLFGMNGYEAGYLIKDAIERAGIKNTKATLKEDRIKFRDGLEKATINSITGEKLVFSDERDTIKKGFILTIRNSEFVEWDGKPM